MIDQNQGKNSTEFYANRIQLKLENVAYLANRFIVDFRTWHIMHSWRWWRTQAMYTTDQIILCIYSHVDKYILGM